MIPPGGDLYHDLHTALNDLPAQENDLLSELLVQSPLSPGTLREVWTGGMGHRTRRSSLFYWHGSEREWGVDQFRDCDRILDSNEWRGWEHDGPCRVCCMDSLRAGLRWCKFVENHSLTCNLDQQGSWGATVAANNQRDIIETVIKTFSLSL